MTREKIQMTSEVVTKNQIDIAATHVQTIFCRMHRIQYPNLSTLEKEVKQLRKDLKEQKVKLNKTDTLKTLKEQKQAYIEMVDDYNDTFDKLVEAWKKKLEDGVYTGYTDDEYMNNVIRPLRNKLIEMDYQTSLLNRIKSIERKVNETKNEIICGTKYISIAI
ncbi:hypothetical protein KDN24_06370 [Bacillus sp. Bva_UNVM-123]|uniref:hypothetical protein n=1 Tax=Bacillus sp. Bva_UNVM-123 TaxID=2829798 RepID=UPI00391FA0E2